MMRFLILTVCFVFLSFPINAESEKSNAVSPRLYKKLQKIEQLIAKKSYQQAQQTLEALLPDIEKNSYEEATVLRSLASIHALKGHYKMAARLLSKCLDLNVLPEGQEQQSILNLGQLYLATNQYYKAIDTMESWLNTHPIPNAQINGLVANAYAQTKQYRKALPYIKKAIAQSKKPEESWYQLNLALYYELEDYPPATRLLKTIIRLYPDKETYWHQLSSTYQQIKQYSKAVSIKHLAYKKGFVKTEKGILDLVNLFLYVDSPYKAAKLLKQEIGQKRVKSNSKNWETLANAWTTAKEFEYATKALENASKLNNKGRLYLQLGQVYVEQENWNQAIIALNKAIGKGGLKKAGIAYILRGMSYYELKKKTLAKKSFLKAAQYDKNRKAAQQWLEYLKEVQ